MGLLRRLRELETRVAVLEAGGAPSVPDRLNVSHEMPPPPYVGVDELDAHQMWRDAADTYSRGQDDSEEGYGVYL